MFDFFQDLLVHHAGLLALLPDFLLFGMDHSSLGEVITEYQRAFLNPFLFQGLIPWESFKKNPEEGVCSSEVQGYNLAVCPALPSQDPELMVAEAKDNFDLHIANKSFLVCKYEVQRFLSIRVSVKDKLDIKHAVVLCVHLLILLTICDCLRKTKESVLKYLVYIHFLNYQCKL